MYLKPVQLMYIQKLRFPHKNLKFDTIMIMRIWDKEYSACRNFLLNHF